jgi:hypothetical protein
LRERLIDPHADLPARVHVAFDEMVRDKFLRDVHGSALVEEIYLTVALTFAACFRRTEVQFTCLSDGPGSQYSQEKACLGSANLSGREVQ